MSITRAFHINNRRTIQTLNAFAALVLTAALFCSCSVYPDSPESSLSGASAFSSSSVSGGSRASGINSLHQTSSGDASSSSQIYALVDPSLPAQQIQNFLNSPELKLVNRENTLLQDYEPELSDVTKYSSSGKTRRIAAPCYDALCALMDASHAAGMNTRLVSGYRSYATQKSNYDANVKSYIKKGYSEAKAVAITQRTIMPPGASEHQYGYAADIAESSSLDTGLEKTKAYTWLAKNAPDYGFILRYPKNKQSITGVSYEPWHFRYVGVYHARIITQNGVCLEEYIGALQARLSELS